MDLARGLPRAGAQTFPQARIVADRFHVIRLVNHHFLACWRELDPVGAKNRGLLSLMRRHRHNLKPEQNARASAISSEQPAMEVIYRFKQRLCYLLLEKRLKQKSAVNWRRACCAMIARTAGRRTRSARRSSATRSIPGEKKSPPCGDSPETTASPKASTPKWKFCSAKPTASATSTTTDCGLRYCVLEIGQRRSAPIKCVEPKLARLLTGKKIWRARRGSNPRPTDSKSVALSN